MFSSEYSTKLLSYINLNIYYVTILSSFDHISDKPSDTHTHTRVYIMNRTICVSTYMIQDIVDLESPLFRNFLCLYYCMAALLAI